MTASLRVSAQLGSSGILPASVARLRPETGLNSFHSVLEHQSLDHPSLEDSTQQYPTPEYRTTQTADEHEPAPAADRRPAPRATPHHAVGQAHPATVANRHPSEYKKPEHDKPEHEKPGHNKAGHRKSEHSKADTEKHESASSTSAVAPAEAQTQQPQVKPDPAEAAARFSSPDAPAADDPFDGSSSSLDSSSSNPSAPATAAEALQAQVATLEAGNVPPQPRESSDSDPRPRLAALQATASQLAAGTKAKSGAAQPEAAPQNSSALNLAGFTLADGTESIPTSATAADSFSASPESKNGVSGDGRGSLAEMRAEVSASTPANPNDHVAFEAQLSTDPSSSNGNAAQPDSQVALLPGINAAASTVVADATPTSNSPAAKPGSLFQTGVAPADSGTTYLPGARNAPAQADVSASARMQEVADEPPAPASNPHNITVRVAGPDDSAGIDLRFVERGGNIHLSVRTPDADVARDLRGGLHELVGSLQHAGIHAEVSAHSAHSQDTAHSQDHHQPQDNPGGRGNSGGGQPGSQNQQQSPRDSRSFRWMEALDAFSVRTPFALSPDSSKE